MTTATTFQFLEGRPDSAYRQLFIKGTRIRAELVYRAHVDPEQPLNIDELALDFGLPRPAIQEAIEYCRSNPPEIAADAADEEALMSARGQLNPDYKFDARPRVLTPQELHRLQAS
jgi:uncharacterized protein (DUF433 family)